MPETTVRPLRPDEFDAWRRRSERFYAENMVEAGGIDPEAAARKARTDFDALLAGGIETAGHAFFAIEESDDPIGSLWLAERTDDQGRMLFVYEVYLEAEARGKGHGREAMRFAEGEARRRGIPAVTLNVFGGNEPARGLYRSLGYRELAVYMRKEL
jgi:ribosomal protein S18 acetylase RimI-like enzyme